MISICKTVSMLLLGLALPALLCCIIVVPQATAADNPVSRYSVNSGSSSPFSSIQGAYGDPATQNNDVLRCVSGLLGEALLFTNQISVTFIGGFDPAFNSSTGMTKVNSLTVSGGPVKARKLTLVPCICGNGVTESGEQCDDGNLVDGDGCSATCMPESGYYCNGSPSVCAALCGDGILSSAEACDDGNTNSGDGCSAACTVESGYSCIGSPSVCGTVCGDGIKAGSEQCDDGNTTSGDGCSSTCQIEPNFEIELNNTCATATGPFTIQTGTYGTTYGGTLNPLGDVDWFRFTVPAYADLSFETFDINGAGTCVTPVDTVVQLYQADCTTSIASDDDSGVNSCSLLNSTTQAAMKHLAPGTYNLKVAAYSTSTSTFGYRLQAKYTAMCGNGIIEGSEQCDGEAGCDTDCMRIPVCGNGLIDKGEQCDDGNTTNGDGCGSTCQLEIATETEPNNTCATSNGPYTIPMGSFGKLIRGSISPAADQDWYNFTLTSYADVWFETFDSTGPGSCASIDTVLQLYKSDCTTAVSTAQDQGGIGNCSRLNGTTQTAMKHLAPGNYALKVYPYSSSVTFNYTLQTKLSAVCGNGIVEGSEQCDGGPLCAADCMRIPVCGDGFVDGNEQCDDGNKTSGDGCSATCQWENFELEPNDTIANANTNAVSNPLYLINGDRIIAGGISSGSDKDIYKVVVPQNNTVVQFETFDSSGSDCRTTAPYNMSAHYLRLLDNSGTVIISDTASSGIGVCPALTYRLDAGTYYVQVDYTAPLATYVLKARFLTDKGSEIEPDDTSATATPLTGSNMQVFGNHQVETDTDYYAVTVPAGASIRVETIEGDTNETCESNGIDSYLTLYNATGTSLGTNDDSGRGYCSLIDGSGSTPLNSFAHNLAAGTYYIAVTKSPTVTGIAAQFNYRLAVNIR